MLWPRLLGELAPGRRHEFQSPGEVGNEDAAGIGFGSDNAPFIETWIHLRDVLGVRARVLGEVQPAPCSKHSFVELIEEDPETMLDRKVETEHEPGMRPRQRRRVTGAHPFEDIEERTMP